jgi:hypothetical protein
MRYRVNNLRVCVIQRRGDRPYSDRKAERKCENERENRAAGTSFSIRTAAGEKSIRWPRGAKDTSPATCPTYERGCQGQTSRSQGQGAFWGPRHPAISPYRYTVDPAPPFDLYRTLPVHPVAGWAESSDDLSSNRDFSSTSAVLLTTVLSEAL